MIIIIVIVVNFFLLYVWIIPDYTDPEHVEKWRRRYVGKFWSQGIPYTLRQAATFMSAVLFVAAPVWFWYGYSIANQLPNQPGDGGRSMSSKPFDARYMRPRDPNYASSR